MRDPDQDRRTSDERGVLETAADLERRLTDQVQQQPLMTVGVAAGVGYVLGGGLQSRLTALLLATATRVALALVARELGARLSPTFAPAAGKHQL